MSSPAQALASQNNGARSQGPVTAQGREISSRNATRHGLTAATVVLDWESPEAFEALRKSFEELYHPRTVVEHRLVHQLAASQWRIARAARFEALLLNNEIEKLQNEPENPLPPNRAAAEAFRILMEKGGALSQLLRHESSLWRAYEKARKQLEELALFPAPVPPQSVALQNEPEPETRAERPARPKAERPLPKLPTFSAHPKLPPNMRLIDPHPRSARAAAA